MRLALALLLTTAASAQWQLQQSNTTADLRGIHALGNGVAWASGSKGTVLRTTDNGKTWQPCAVPPGAEALDFRGVQAFDAQTAIVMSSGKGELSRLYKTSDGCKTWLTLYKNPDAEGFWDALQFTSRSHGFLLGDPVSGPGDAEPHFFVQETSDGGTTWRDWHDRPGTLATSAATAIFAASNSSMIAKADMLTLATGGPVSASVVQVWRRYPYGGGLPGPAIDRNAVFVHADPMPFVFGASAGIFAMAAHGTDVMLVGGDYTKPKSDFKNALLLRAGNPESPTTPPHGYRSSVAYLAAEKAWITVGPNGTDVSTNDGRNWRALRPGPQAAPDEDQHWNALSLPFVVGPHGRIGLLRPEALKP